MEDKKSYGDWQQRLLQERDELQERLDRLEEAYYSKGFKDKVGEKQHDLIFWQSQHMWSYLFVLNKRIKDLGLE